MGQEAACTVRHGDRIYAGKASLETDYLAFRGDLRLKIMLREIETLIVEDGALEVRWPGGSAAFDLGGRAATKWAETIRNPRTRADKLGVKAGQRVRVLGVVDEHLVNELSDRGLEVTAGAVGADADIIFYEADTPEDLVRLPELRGAIKQNGAVWVVSPKGNTARIRDVDVMAASRDAGLVDVKVVSFSETHTALKLVIPVAQRK